MTRSAWLDTGKPRHGKQRISDLNNSKERYQRFSFYCARDLSLSLALTMRPHENDVHECVHKRAHPRSAHTTKLVCVVLCVCIYRQFYVFLCFSLFPFLKLRFFLFCISWTICLVFQLKASIFFCCFFIFLSLFYSIRIFTVACLIRWFVCSFHSIFFFTCILVCCVCFIASS